MDKLTLTTKDLTQDNIEKIAQLFPQVITEKEDEDGNIIKAIDFDLLKQELSKEIVDDDNERYRLDWPGKKASILKANTPITDRTLRPVKDESVNFDETENLFIEGDNFEVLKLLQESYLGKIKMIYIDPPYNTGKDRIYKDTFKKTKSEYEEDLEIIDANGGILVKNLDTNGRYHSDWLSMMSERLLIAKDFLTDDGVIFISIDDNEQVNLKKLCDEIFGEPNFVAQNVWQKIHSTKNDAKYFSDNHEYVLCYAHDISQITIELLDRSEAMDARYQNPDNDPRGPWQSGDLVANEPRKDGNYDVLSPSGNVFNVPSNKHWVYSKTSMESMLGDNRVWFGKTGDSFPRKKRFLSEVQSGKKPDTLWLSTDVGHNQEGKRELLSLFDGISVFETPKPIRLMKRIIELATKNSKNAIILDFFSGSGATAHAVMQLNVEDGGARTHIQVQLPEKTYTIVDGLEVAAKESEEAFKAGYRTIADVAKERIRRAAKKIQDDNKDIDLNNIDFGFRVYKTDSTNMKKVDKHPDEVNQLDLEDMINNFKDDRTPEDILAQVMLNLGLELSLKIEEKEIKGNKVFFVAENSLVACFDEDISDLDSFVNEIAKTEPLKVVFRDYGFKDDKDRINVENRFKRLSPETKISVI